MTIFLIHLYHLIIEGVIYGKDITIEKLMLGGDKLNKSVLVKTIKKYRYKKCYNFVKL